jgi:hypothetical protein
MKKDALKKMGFLFAILMVLAGNLVGITAWATEDGMGSAKSNSDDPPDGLLVGYLPGTTRIKIGEHVEAWGGWVGAPLYHVVTDYQYLPCCRRTYVSLDGCKGLPVCTD